MSSSPSEPEYAAPTAPVRAEQGYNNNSQDGPQNSTSKWTLPTRPRPESLLTQALNSNSQADVNSSLTGQLYHSPNSLTNPSSPFFPSPDREYVRNNDLNIERNS